MGFHPYPKTREEEQDQLTAVLITKSQAKYWPFFFAAGVLKVWALFSAIAGSSARALKRAMLALKSRFQAGWASGNWDAIMAGSSLI